jgi:hypothetical protein
MRREKDAEFSKTKTNEDRRERVYSIIRMALRVGGAHPNDAAPKSMKKKMKYLKSVHIAGKVQWLRWGKKKRLWPKSNREAKKRPGVFRNRTNLV